MLRKAATQAAGLGHRDQDNAGDMWPDEVMTADGTGR